jgi:hypothetical protein
MVYGDGVSKVILSPQHHTVYQDAMAIKTICQVVTAEHLLAHCIFVKREAVYRTI